MRSACRFSLNALSLFSCLVLAACGSREQGADGAAARTTGETRIVRTHATPRTAKTPRAARPADPRPEERRAGADGPPTSPTIAGRVTLPGGAPAPGTTITLQGTQDFYAQVEGVRLDAPAPRQPDLVAVAAADGTFQLRVPELPTYPLRVRREGYATAVGVLPGYFQGYGAPPPDPMRADVELTTASRVSGRVTGPDGKPVGGALLTATPVLPSGRSRESRIRFFPVAGESRTTTEGLFAISDAAASSTINLMCDLPGYVPVSREVIPPAENLDIRLTRDGAVVEGNVFLHPTGEGVAEASVTLNMGLLQGTRRTGGIRREVRTDSLGAFRFAALPAGNAMLDAQKGDTLRLFRDTARGGGGTALALAEKETTSGVRLVVYPGHAVRGTVMDNESGDPIPGVELAVAAGYPGRRGTPQADPSTSPVLTDARGFYRLEHVFPRFGRGAQLTVKKDGYQPVQDRPGYDPSGNLGVPLELASDDLDVVRNIRMSRTVTIRGRVKKSNGDPVPLATVKLYATNQGPGFGRDSNSTTRADGTFEMNTLPNRQVRVLAQASDLAPGISPVIELGAKPVENVEIILTPGCNVAGVVVDPDGKPVQGASVTASVTAQVGNSGFGVPSKSVETGARGQFAFANQATFGQLYLGATAKGFAQAKSESLTLAEGKDRTDVRLVLQKSFFISGKVTDESGSAVDGVSISASRSNGSGYGNAQTSETGVFRIEGLTEGTYSIQAYKEGRNANLENVETGRTDANIVLRAPNRDNQATPTPGKVRFVGTVVDARTRQTLDDFSARGATYSNTSVKRLTESGKFAVEGLRRGIMLQLTVDAPGYRPQQVSVQVDKDEGTVEQTIELGTGGTITGRAVTGSSPARPLAGVRVDLLNLGGGTAMMYGYYGSFAASDYSRIPSTASTQTGSDGRFRFEKVSAGPAAVALKTESMISRVTRQGTVKHGSETDLGDIPIPSGSGIRGQVVRQPGRVGMADTRVMISVNGGYGNKDTRTGPDGRFEFPGIGSGQYNLSAPDLGASTYVELTGSTDKDVLIEVGSATMEGMVTRRGKPAEASLNLNLQRQGDTHLHRYASVASDGLYKIENLVGGEWDVWVGPGGGGGGNSTVKVRVPSQGIVRRDFTLPSGRAVVRVEDAKGQPVERVLVSVQQVRTDSRPSGSEYNGNQSTGSDGTVAFNSLPGGRYRASATHSEKGMGTSEPFDVPEDGDAKPVTLRLGAGSCTVVSTVLRFSDGRPLPEASISLHRTDGGQSLNPADKRDANGTVRVTGLDPGRYSVCVGARWYKGSCKTVELEPGKTATVEDVLTEGGDITWRVLDAGGNPARNMQVMAEPADPNSIETRQNSWLQSDGVARFQGLLPGEYLLSAKNQQANKIVGTAKAVVRVRENTTVESRLSE